MRKSPLPLFDSSHYIDNRSDYAYLTKEYVLSDIDIAIRFLRSYKDDDVAIDKKSHESKQF